MSYKAKINFSFDGKNYVEGQEIPFTDESVLATLEKRGQIAKGSGKSISEITAEQESEILEKSAAADEQRAKEAADREKEFIAQGGKPKPSVRLKEEDQTKEKVSKAGPNAPKK